MVNRVRRLLLTFGSAMLLAVSLPARDMADYRIGDRVTEDIITPVPLMVVDPVATAALKAREAQRSPAIFRFNESAAATVEADARKTFSLARSNFLFLMSQSFQRSKLKANALTSPQFQRLIADFRQQDPTFPLSVELAEAWARGERSNRVQTDVLTRLHALMERPIRADKIANVPKFGSKITLVPVAKRRDTITLETVQQRGHLVARTNLLTVSRARLALAESFGPEEAELAAFAGSYLRANCFLELQLTETVRARDTAALFVADNYSAGQVIARAGQTLDQKMMAALGQLQEKTAAGRLTQQVVQEKNQVAQVRRRNQWLGAGLGLTSLLLVVVWLTRRRRPATLLPARIADGLPANTAAGSWQQRALVAEQQVDQARASVRAGALTQLARLFREKLVRGLISQRGELLDAQQSAAAEMMELEKRLSDLHAPLQERLRAYETRIADLESALAVKGQENRELIKAKIQLIRHQMEAERTRDRLEFN